MASTQGIQVTLVGGERSHHYAIPCYQLPCNWTVRAIARAHLIKWLFLTAGEKILRYSCVLN